MAEEISPLENHGWWMEQLRKDAKANRHRQSGRRTEMRHTPGPWHYRRGDEWSHSVVTHHGTLPDGSQNCWTVADINKMREPAHEANARLIAAAPDLLEALRVFVSCSLPVSTEIDERGHRWTEAYLDQALPIARAAIAKAEGEKT
jgi:hypothetical protein